MSLSDDGTYGSTYKTLGFTGNSNGSHRIFAGTADDMYFAAATARGFQFWTNGSTATRMAITSSGNVGIGTPSPGSYRLNVDTSAAQGIQLNGTGTGGSWMLWSNNGSANGYITSAYHAFTSGSATNFAIRAENNLVLGTGANPRITILSSGNVLIGTDTDNGSKLRVNGSLALPHVTKSANYTLDASDYTVGFDCASNRTANLPDATTCAGRIYVIYQYNTASGGSTYVTLDGNGSQTIDGVTTYSLQYQENFSSVMIQSTGSNWVVIADKVYPSPV
jgi:hypothetical protein